MLPPGKHAPVTRDAFPHVVTAPVTYRQIFTGFSQWSSPGIRAYQVLPQETVPAFFAGNVVEIDLGHYIKVAM